MSQEEYLGPQRGRTDLGAFAYTYPKPTKEFRTLALTPQHRDETPVGNQHLRYEGSPSTNSTNLQMWDLVPIEGGGGTYECYSPLILRDRTTNELFAPTQTAFTPAASRWVVAELTESAGDIVAEIKMITTLTTSWAFSASPDYEWTSSTIPLYRLVGTAEAGTEFISTGVWGRKLVPSRPLRLFVSMDVVPSTSHLRSVMDLL